MQNKYNPIIFACLIAVGIFIGQKISNKDQVRINDKINSIIQLIDSHYVDTLNNNFEEDIINSIIKDLDPHTSYISKKSYKTVEESMQGGFSGIGIEFNIINDKKSIIIIPFKLIVCLFEMHKEDTKLKKVKINTEISLSFIKHDILYL